PVELDPKWESLEALIESATAEVLDPVTEPPAPLPVPAPLFEDPVDDPLEGATEEAFSVDDTVQSDPALPDRLPRAITLPRAQRWSPKSNGTPTPPPPPPIEPTPSEDTPLSDEIRRQVRERLEAHV